VDGASLVQEVLETAHIWWPKGYLEWMSGWIWAIKRAVGVWVHVRLVDGAGMQVRLAGKPVGDQQLDAR
jgi:hypothetical protein